MGIRIDGQNDSIISSIFADTYDRFPVGTALLFQQTSAPTGWTKSTTHNDKALRVVSGTVTTGGTTAFSAVLNGSVNATTLTTAQIPSHTHTYDRNAGNTASGSGDTGGSIVSTASGPAGGGGSHTHSMDVQYVDVIIATKN